MKNPVHVLSQGLARADILWFIPPPARACRWGSAIKAVTVAVEDRAIYGACPEGLLQALEDEIGAQVIGEAPADDASRAEVDHDRKIEPAGAGGNEGNVADLDSILNLGGPPRAGTLPLGFWFGGNAQSGRAVQTAWKLSSTHAPALDFVGVGARQRKAEVSHLHNRGGGTPLVPPPHHSQLLPQHRGLLAKLEFHLSHERHPQRIDRAGAKPALAGDPLEDARRGILHDRHRRGHRARRVGRRLHHARALGRLAQAARPRARQRREHSARPSPCADRHRRRQLCQSPDAPPSLWCPRDLSATAASANTPGRNLAPKEGNINRVVPRFRGAQTS